MSIYMFLFNSQNLDALVASREGPEQTAARPDCERASC